MADYLINTVQEFQEQVGEDYKSWDTKTYPWFRGEPTDSITPLCPKLYREKNVDGTFRYDENQLVQFFRMKAPALLRDVAPIARRETDLWLFLMQHFGLPTRLLDWTEGAFIALYFALKLKAGKPTVWMLNPIKLNELAFNVGDGETISRKHKLGDNQFSLTWFHPKNSVNIGSENIDGAWEEDKKGITLPVAIQPTSIHLRMSVQRSCFTVQGKWKYNLMECIEEIDNSSCDTNYLPNILKRYDINGEQSGEMLEELRMLGVSNTTVYPDIEGLSEELMTSKYTFTDDGSRINNE